MTTRTSTPRVAVSTDEDAVRQLLTEADLPLDGLAGTWRMLVIDDDAGLAGVAALERHADSAGTAYLLRSVAVRSDRRGGGLGDQLVRAALVKADGDAGATANVALLTETAVGYFERFGFRPVDRTELPRALDASPQFAGACPDTAQGYLRP